MLNLTRPGKPAQTLGRWVRVEQAVYGSFPFRTQGFGLLARSAGCEPGWIAAFKQACEQFGERPTGAEATGAWSAQKLAKGPWMLIGTSEQGADDRGRPGALGFHALFIPARAYLQAGATPFPWLNRFQTRWSVDCDGQNLAAFDLPEPEPVDLQALAGTEISPHRIDAAVYAMQQRRRLVIESACPIDAWIAAVLNRLPVRTRERLQVTNWSFGSAPGFDLAGVPARSGKQRFSGALGLADLDAIALPRQERARIWNWAKQVLGH